MTKSISVLKIDLQPTLNFFSQYVQGVLRVFLFIFKNTHNAFYRKNNECFRAKVIFHIFKAFGIYKPNLQVSVISQWVEFLTSSSSNECDC